MPSVETEPATATADRYVLEVEGVDISYGDTSVVHDVSLVLAPGERAAIVGQSGSGKSTVISAIMGLLAGEGHVTRGEIRYRGENLVAASESRLRRLRGRSIALIPQDPMSNLNPSMRVGDQIADALRTYGVRGREEVRQAVVRLMGEAGIPDAERRRRQFPHEFSGGMRQRVLIAIALAGDPDLVIADEPTSALDVTVQKQILDHLEKLVRERGTSLLFVTHDLGVAADRTDTILVMHRGRVVERGAPAAVLRTPQHDYTKELLAASPTLEVSTRESPAPAEPEPPLLDVRELTKVYPIRGRRESLTALDQVSFTAARGRTTAVIGESGSGKSTTAKIVLGLEAPTSGSVLLDGTSVTTTTRADRSRLRRFTQPVFQDPYSSLDPTFSVERIIAEPLRVFRLGSRAEQKRRVADLLDAVALPSSVAEARPSELSGGQRQRVAIARAMASTPEMLVCDEAVSALDVLVQAQILSLLRDLQDELGLSVLFITHDLSVVAGFAHDVVVMRHGQVVESGPVQEIIISPRQYYTRELLDAVPGREIARA